MEYDCTKEGDIINETAYTEEKQMKIGNKLVTYTIERVYLGLITKEKMIENIIKAHIDK